MDVIPAAPPAPARTRRCSADAPALLLLGSAAAVEPSSSSRVGAALAPAGCSGPKTRSSRFCCLRVCSCSGAEQKLSHPAQLTKTPRSTDRRDGVCLTAGTKSASLTADACLTVKSGRASRVAAKPPPVYAADTVPRAAAAAAPAAHRTAEITSAGASPSPRPATAVGLTRRAAAAAAAVHVAIGLRGLQQRDEDRLDRAVRVGRDGAQRALSVERGVFVS
jgi:hypothetical protein